MKAGDHTRIRSLTAADVDDAFALSSSAGWNQRAEDWRMLLQLAPRGSVAAEHDGRLIGTAIGIDYGGFGWIAMMLVDPRCRGQGLGGRLLEAAMASLPAGLTIRLDATPLGRTLYERHGFRDEARLTRYVAEEGQVASRPPHPGAAIRVRPLERADLSAIASEDGAVFRGDRERVLGWTVAAAPQYAHVAAGGAGGLQYCSGRTGRLFDQVGPVVAIEERTACELVRSAIASAGTRPLVVDAFDRDDGFAAWLRASGFTPQRPLFRMFKPAPGDEGGWPSMPPSGLREFAICGPEFG